MEENIGFVYNGTTYDIQDVKGKNRKTFAEIEFLERIKTILPESPVIIDCGGNIGSHTIFFVSECGALVHTFEPMTDNYDTLMRNCDVNKINIYPYHHALSAKGTPLKCISALPNTSGSNWLWYEGEKGVHPADQGYKIHENIPKEILPTEVVPSVTLDEGVAVGNKLDFIKIDVEGMEAEVLNGAVKLIENFHPKLYVEVSEGNKTFMYKWILNNNYKRTQIDLFEKHHWFLE